MGRRVGRCQSSQTAPCKHKRVAVEIGSHMAKLDLSPPACFLLFLSLSEPLVLLSVAFKRRRLSKTMITMGYKHLPRATRVYNVSG